MTISHIVAKAQTSLCTHNNKHNSYNTYVTAEGPVATVLATSNAMESHKIACVCVWKCVYRLDKDVLPLCPFAEPLASLSHASAVPEKSSALNLSHYLKQWFQSAEAAGVDGTTKSTVRTITGRLRINPETASSDKQAQLLKMISALEELHRTLNNTLSSRITIMPRGTDERHSHVHLWTILCLFILT